MIFTRFEDVTPVSYDLIVADPPWRFDTRSPQGQTRKSASAHYATMSLAEIKALPVHRVAARDCVLWLWTCNPHLKQGIEVLEAWGFEFKTAGHWVKTTAHGKLAFGTGYIFRGAGEPFLIGTIGAPTFARNVRSVLMAQVREHSRKPEEAFAMAEQLVPLAARRLEMFSRSVRPGWDSFGNEVGKFEEAA